MTRLFIIAIAIVACWLSVGWALGSFLDGLAN